MTGAVIRNDYNRDNEHCNNNWNEVTTSYLCDIDDFGNNDQDSRQRWWGWARL